MSTKIRLARGGSKKKPFYRVVIADSRAPRDGKFIEKVGTYNPMLSDKKARVELKEDRIQHWLEQGAIPSDRVLVFLNDLKLGQEFVAVKDLNKKRDNVIELKKEEIAARKKAEEEKRKAEEAEKKAQEEAEKAEAEAAAKAEEEAKAAAEAEANAAPAEEAPAEEKAE